MTPKKTHVKKYTFGDGYAKGLGEHRAAKDEGLELTDDSKARDGLDQSLTLDMKPGTEVTLIGRDEERDLVLVEWEDSEGVSRTTSVDDAHFEKHFKAVSK